jgi:hypothetical protein
MQMSHLDEIKLEIEFLKRLLADLWEVKGKTDQEILALADKIDILLNEYDRCMQDVAS